MGIYGMGSFPMLGSPAEILNYANNLNFNIILKKIILTCFWRKLSTKL